MKKYIIITKEDREFIAKALGVTERMVFKGVRYESDTDLAKRIRKLAMARGGVEMAEVPVAETMHCEGGMIRQWLLNGALIELNRNDGSCDVLWKGQKVKHWDDVRLRDLDFIYSWAMAMG